MVGTFTDVVPTSEAMERTLVDQPDVANALRVVHAAAWASVDPTILELCRLRIAQLLGNDAELAAGATEVELPRETVAALRSWPSSPLFGGRERACLALCEQSLVDVANVSVEHTEAVARALGLQGLVDFVSALLVVEQRQRLRLTWAKLFPDGGSDGT
jgi:hypothetical protein